MYIIYIICILIVVILYLLYKNKYEYEYFSNNDLNLYVISLKQQNRLQNIKNQETKIGQTINIFDGVNGDTLDVFNVNISNITINNSFYSSNTKKIKRQLGCYLSHFNLYNKIKNDKLYGYSIIFEDDFEILTDKLIDKCNIIIHKLKELNLDFDIIFLGNYDYNENHGKLITDNIYKVGNKEELHGLQGYVVNYNNIDKIINNTKNITITIDDKLQELADNNMLNVFSIYPYYIGTGNQPTIIAEPFTSYSFV